MTSSVEINNTFCNCLCQKLPNSNFVHSSPNLCSFCWTAQPPPPPPPPPPFFSPPIHTRLLYAHQHSSVKPNTTVAAVVRQPCRSNFHIQRGNAEVGLSGKWMSLLRHHSFPFILRQGKDDITAVGPGLSQALSGNGAIYSTRGVRTVKMRSTLLWVSVPASHSLCEMMTFPDDFSKLELVTCERFSYSPSCLKLYMPHCVLALLLF